MNIEEVQRVARLAKIELTDEECRTLQKQFQSILDYIRKIDELDLADTLPVSHPFNITNVFRDDTVREHSGFTPKLMKIAPASARDMVQVPSVIEAKS